MGRTILLAIADDSTAEKHEQFFRLKGFNVLRTTRGTDCWKLLQDRRADAVILDETLPWGGGDGVLALLQEEANDFPIPVVLLSNSAPAESGVRDRQPRGDEKHPVVARLSRASSLPVVLESVLLGLHDC